MKRGTTKFAAKCWWELMRFLEETIIDDENIEYPEAREFLKLATKIAKKVECDEC